MKFRVNFRLLWHGTVRVDTVMTPGHCYCLCVTIVLLFTSCALEAASESILIKKDNTKPPDLPKKSSNGGERSVTSKAPLIFDCVQEDTECKKDKFGYEAIVQLHRLLDDDRNGNVDQSESDEFLRDELQYTDGFERHSLFHNNDKLISVEDLWRAWKHSEVYNWTVEDVGEWLQKEVDLPQYSSIFSENSVCGAFLPRLAASSTFMTSVLGIKNPVHKQKLSLKAMDTVLFGAPPKRHNFLKDLALMVSLIFAVGGSWFGYLHHRYSQEQVRKMMMDLESLQKAEEALMDVQRKLQDAESRQVSTIPRPPPDFKEGTAVPDADPMVVHHYNREGHGEGTQQIREELAATLLALEHAENQLEYSWAPPGELQAWLQLTHELEQAHYTAKRQAAERQFQGAKDVCDKIKRRNKAFFGSLRMAHSNSLDEIDQRILDAKAALEEVKQDLQERLHRWHTIERLCGFPIISNPGLPALHQMLHGPKDGAVNGTRLAAGVVGPVSVDEADEDLPSAGYPSIPHSLSQKSFVRQRAVMGSTGSLSHLVHRNAVNVNAAYSIHHPHPSLPSTLPLHPHPPQRSATQDISMMDSPTSPTSSTLSNPVSFHLGDQVPERSTSYKTQSSYPPLGASVNGGGGGGGGIVTHVRSKSITSSTQSSVSSSHHLHHHHPGGWPGGYMTMPSSGGMSSLGRSQSTLGYNQSNLLALSRAGTVEESNDLDNLSHTTLDSLPRSVSSVSHMGGRMDNSASHLNPPLPGLNNGLDLLMSHTPSAGGVGGSGLGGPCLLEKKPSKRKKLMNMLRKASGKQKPV